VFTVLLTLHVLFAVAIVGALVHVVTTVGRGLRAGDAVAIGTASRSTLIYTIASVVIVLIGGGLMSATSPYTGKATASFSDTFIWLSLLLWVIAVVVSLVLVVRGLNKAEKLAVAGESTAAHARSVMIGGGIVAVLLLVIVVLMVVRP